MSLILDALKRTEAERKFGPNVVVNIEDKEYAMVSRRSVWPRIVIIVLFVLIGGGIGLSYFYKNDEPQVAVVKEPAAKTPAVQSQTSGSGVVEKSPEPVGPAPEIKAEKPPAPEVVSVSPKEPTKPEPIIAKEPPQITKEHPLSEPLKKQVDEPIQITKAGNSLEPAPSPAAPAKLETSKQAELKVSETVEPTVVAPTPLPIQAPSTAPIKETVAIQKPEPTVTTARSSIQAPSAVPLKEMVAIQELEPAITPAPPSKKVLPSAPIIEASIAEKPESIVTTTPPSIQAPSTAPLKETVAIQEPEPTVTPAPPSIKTSSYAPIKEAMVVQKSEQIVAIKEPEKETLFASIVPPRKPAVSTRRGAAKDYLKSMRQAANFEQSGKLTEAVDAYTQAISARPDLADAYVGRGWAHEANRAYEAAIEDFSKAIELNPEAADTYYALGWSFEQSRQAALAIDNYSRAIIRAPGDFESYFSRGFLLYYEKDTPAAIQDFAVVYENAPAELADYALLWMYLARAENAGISPQTNKFFANKHSRSKWPGIIYSAFMGDKTTDNVLAAMKHSDPLTQRKRECVGYFFLGLYRALLGDRDGARDYFKKTLATGITNFRQYEAAKIELQKIGAN